MNFTTESSVICPVPRWVRNWAIVTLVLAAILLAIGGFVTSFRVGMADPVWPTVPWFLFGNSHWEFGFVVEHTHRAAGWIVGFAVSVLALAVWWSEPNRRLRWYGIAAMIALLMTYGGFHRGMMQSWAELNNMAKTRLNLEPGDPNFSKVLADKHLMSKIDSWPVFTGVLTTIFAITAIVFGVLSGLANPSGGWLRCLAVVALVAVMIQGLLGGLRVFLNALAGANLAALHGAFGQVSFCILVALAVLALPRRAGDALPDGERARFAKLAWMLVAMLGVQLLWAVMLRHGGSGISQRLHLLTAFLIAGFIAWLLLAIRSRPLVDERIGGSGTLLVALLALQLLLGVEAYIGKFAALGAQAQLPPDARSVSRGQAIMRTTHQLVGCGLLAAAVALALRAGREPVLANTHYETVTKEGNAPAVAAMAFNHELETARDSPPPDVAMMALNPPQDDEPLR